MRYAGASFFSPFLVNLLCFIAIFSGFFFSPSILFAKTKPVKQIANKRYSPVPAFYDDIRLESLDKAVAASLKYLKSIPPGKKFQVCGKNLSVAALKRSLHDLAAILKRSGSVEEFNRHVQSEFEVCRIGDGKAAGKVLVTGYFEPLVDGSLEKRKPYLIPLYRVPDDLVVTKDRDGKSVIGRQAENGVVPYWTREEIEKNGHLAGNELVYVDDPVSAFVLQIQGSGRVRLRDGTSRPIQFAGKNGRPYSSIGKYLVDQGVMPLSDVTLPRIREYLDQNPEEREKILHHNESFIFFKWGDSGARGAIGQVLVPGRSVALDHNFYPPGIMAILQSQRPIVDEKGEIKEWTDFTRFVLNQDTGSAIKGPGRVDLFLGSGQYAEIAAGLMRQQGSLYLLVKKK